MSVPRDPRSHPASPGTKKSLFTDAISSAGQILPTTAARAGIALVISRLIATACNGKP